MRTPEASAQTTPEPPSRPPTTPLPSVTIAGELPSPGATVPPEIPVIARLRFEVLAAATGPLGLACESYRNPTGSYNLGCEGKDASANASYLLAAEYWTLDSVTALNVGVGLLDHDRSIGDPAAVTRVLLPIAALVGGQAASASVESHFDDLACDGQGCQLNFDGSSLWLDVGSGGARSLEIHR